MEERVLDHGPLTPSLAARAAANDLPRVRPRRLALERGRRFAPSSDWRALAIVTGLAMVLGFAQGARVALPAAAASEAALRAPEPSPAPGSVRLPGARTFWRPAGSTAVPPEPATDPSVWLPEGSGFELDAR